MEFKDIKPFVRFVGEFDYKPDGTPMAAPDCRLIYIKSGEGEVLVDGKSRIVGTGALIYCRCGTPYAFTSESVLHVIAVNFDMDASRSDITATLSKMLPELYPEDDGFSRFTDCTVLNGYLILEKATQYERSLERMAEEFRCRRPYYAEKLGGTLISLLSDLLREEMSPKSREISGVIEYINVNFRSRMTNEYLADMAGYHPLHLNRLFKRAVGTTVHNYVLRLRIAEAARLLLSTDMSIADVADAVGFENATHFSTQFKKSEACAPLEYRKRYKDMI